MSRRLYIVAGVVGPPVQEVMYASWADSEAHALELATAAFGKAQPNAQLMRTEFIDSTDRAAVLALLDRLAAVDKPTLPLT